jgi:hypothetical protein
MLLDLILAHRDDRFQVAVNESMDPKQAHGAASVVDAQGRHRNVPFQVDRPSRIKRPTPDQVSDLFKQFDQLGFRAETVFIGRGTAKRTFRRAAVRA